MLSGVCSGLDMSVAVLVSTHSNSLSRDRELANANTQVAAIQASLSALAEHRSLVENEGEKRRRREEDLREQHKAIALFGQQLVRTLCA